MAVAFGAIGAKSAGGTTTVSVPHPASVGAGNLLIAGRCLYQVAGIAATDETGWTAGGKLRGGTGTAADNHATMAAADYREAAGGETGNVTFDQGGTVAGALGIMARYTKGSGVWNVAAATGDDATHAADRSVTSSASIALAPGDVVVAVVAVDTDAALTITSPTFTASGITFGTVNRRTSGAGVTTGNDGNIEVFDVAVSSGTATVAVTLAFTTATTQCGPVSFLRLRETVAPVNGAAVGSFGFTGTSTGVPRTPGAASGPFGFTATASGVDRALGVAAAAFGYTATATGIDRALGAASAPLGFTGSAAGVVTVPPIPGAATASFGFAGSAIGQPRTGGAAVAGFGFTATGSGTPRKLGTAASTFGFASQAAGTPRTLAAAAASFGFAGLGTGIPRVLAVADAAFGFTGVALGEVGAPPVTGAAVADFDFTGSAAGVAGVLGMAEATFGFTGSALGAVEHDGLAEAPFGFTASADGFGGLVLIGTPLERSTTIWPDNRSTVIAPDNRSATILSEPRTTTI